MAPIFFSYRKQGEDKPTSQRLADDFRSVLGEDAVFRDEKGLEPGRYEDQLLDQAHSCDAIIAVIGPTWIKRVENLHNEEDWVRRELEIGLRREILIVPVLVERARQPKQSVLPDALVTLFNYNFQEIHGKYWKSEVDSLINFMARRLNISKRKEIGAVNAQMPNLTGNWVSLEGEKIRLNHRGDALEMMAYNARGQVIGQGAGSVTGNQVQFSLQRIDFGHGTGRGVIAADGQQLSGEVQFGMQRFPFSLTRR